MKQNVKKKQRDWQRDTKYDSCRGGLPGAAGLPYDPFKGNIIWSF